MGDPFTFDSRASAADASPNITGAADGVTLYQPRALEAGEIIGHYRIEGPLGQGGNGTAYAARNIDDEDERVAVKLIRPDRRDRARLVRLLRAEAAALRRVKHEAIVQYRTFKRIPNSDEYYLVTEHIDGPTLGACLQAHAFSVAQVRELAARVSDALDAAHEQGVIHRDLSPDNIILPAGDPALATLIDFGIAKQGAVDPLGMDFVGKLAFAAPEQFAGDPTKIGPWTDLYSLGLVLAAAARGHRLDMGSDFDSAIAARRTLPDLGDVPAELRRPIARLLAPDPEARIRSAAAAPALFAPAITSDETVMAPSADETVLSPSTDRALAEMARVPATPKRSRMAVWLAVGAAVVLAAGPYVAVRRQSPAEAPGPVAVAGPPAASLSPDVAESAASARAAAAAARVSDARAKLFAHVAEAAVARAKAIAAKARDASTQARRVAGESCAQISAGHACETDADGASRAGEQDCQASRCVFHGYAVYRWPNGAIFMGLIDHGRFNLGEYLAVDQTQYYGEFDGPAQNGLGQSMVRDGTTTTGQFKDGKLEGFGLLSFPQPDLAGRKSHAGFFAGGMRNGPGVALWADGSSMAGDFIQDQLAGFGIGVTKKARTEAKYQDWFTLTGVAHYRDGRRYEGAFGAMTVNDDLVEARSGLGVLYAPDGSIESQGRWEDDRLAAPAKQP